MLIIYEYYSFKIKVSSCSCIHGWVMPGKYVYCSATMGSPAYFVPKLQSLKSLLLAHPIGPICPLGCQGL